MHSLILKGILDDQAGVYHTPNVLISGFKHVPPDYSQIPELMILFIQWLVKEGANLHPIARAAVIHSEFVKIHPFVDDNGRTARLLLNFELMKTDILQLSLKKNTGLPTTRL
ncbi:Fic family protein [Cohnella cellulosilytica]|uniref:Fic family protein n=1 Tax=Cohnella cellulosilytica TaxID=986710 RepID=A0ABW2FCI6_9BACL